MKGFNGGMANLLKQATQMQNKIKKIQDEISQRAFTATSGGGAVEVTLNGNYLVQNVRIDAEVLKTGDQELIQDMLKAAFNEAVQTVKKTTESEMQKVTGMPGGFPGLF
jgi:hypothetical protein